MIPRSNLSAEKISYISIPAVALTLYPWSADVILIKNFIGYIIIAAIVVSVLLFNSQHHKNFLTRSPLQLPVIFLLLHICISAGLSDYPWLILPEFVSVIPCLLLVIVLPVIGISANFRDVLARVTAVSVLPVAAYALLQLMGLDPIIWGRPVRDGVFSTFGHPNLLAPFLVIGTASIIYQVYSTRRTLMRWFWSSMGLVTMTLLFLTKSKGAFLGIGSGIIIWILLRNSWDRRTVIRYCIFCLMMLVILSGLYHLGVLDNLITTNSFRVWTWKGALSASVPADPGYRALFGNGPGSFPVLFPQYRDPGFLSKFRHAENLQHAHCEYLETLVEYGLPGTLLLIWFIFVYLKMLRTAIKNGTADALTTLFGIACLSIWIHNLVSVNLQWFSSLFFLYFFSVITIPGKNLPTPMSKKKFRDILLPLLFLLIMTPGVIYLTRQFQSQKLYFNAKMAMADENLSAAMDELTMAVTWNPYNFPAQYDRAYLYARQGKYQMALHSYRFISEHHPNYQRIHRNRSLVLANLYLQEHTPVLLKEAIDELKAELLINQSEEIFFTMGQLSGLANDRKSMIHAYRQYICLYLKTRMNLQKKRTERHSDDLRLVVPREMSDLDEKFNTAMELLMHEDANNTTAFMMELKEKYGDFPEILNRSGSGVRP